MNFAQIRFSYAIIDYFQILKKNTSSRNIATCSRFSESISHLFFISLYFVIVVKTRDEKIRCIQHTSYKNDILIHDNII